jgi:hypothetical protein
MPKRQDSGAGQPQLVGRFRSTFMWPTGMVLTPHPPSEHATDGQAFCFKTSESSHDTAAADRRPFSFAPTAVAGLLHFVFAGVFLEVVPHQLRH